MSHDISHHSRKKVKDTLILFLIFAIGLAGLCYILSVSANASTASTYNSDAASPQGESIYFTASR